MKKKIVVLYLKPEDKESLSEIFEQAVQQGVEIFFCENKESALKLIESEKPHLLILDDQIDLAVQTIPTLLLHDKKDKSEGLIRPLHKNQVLEKCLAYLDLSHIENPQEIPM